MLHPIADGFRLKKLGCIQQGAEIRRVQKRLLHIVHNLAVGAGIPLVLFHHIRKNIPVLRQCKRLACLQGGESLKAELRHVPEIILTVCRKRPIAVPYFPVMYIPSVLITRIVKTATG